MRHMRVFGGPAPTIDRSTLPPGPGWPPLLQSIGLLRFRHQFVPWAHRRYGDVFTVRLLPDRPLVLFTRPEHAREIFAADPETFLAGKANAILGPMMGEHSLLLQDRGAHQRARKLLMPAFNGHALREYGDLVTEVARAEARHLVTTARSSARPRPDEPAHPRGDPARRLRRDRRAPARRCSGRGSTGSSTSARPSSSAGPCHGCAGSARGSAARQNAHELDQLIHAEIRERRTAPDLATRTDVLSRLIRARRRGAGTPLTDEELRDQLVTLLLAGHETTATALAWALYELGRDAALLARTDRGAPTTGTTSGWRPCSRSRCACTRSSRWWCARSRPGHHRRHRPAGGGDGRARRSCIAHARPENHPEPDRVPAGAVRRGQPGHRTPGSPSAAAYAGASAPASR